MSLPSLTTAAMNVHPPLAASAGGIAGALQTGVGIVLTILLGVLLPIAEIWFQIVVTASVACGLWAWHRGRLRGSTKERIPKGATRDQAISGRAKLAPLISRFDLRCILPSITG